MPVKQQQAAVASVVQAASTISEGTVLSIHKGLLKKKLDKAGAASRAVTLASKMEKQSQDWHTNIQSEMHPLVQKELFLIMTT